MNTEASFNINELISYLLPGSILVAIFFYFFCGDITPHLLEGGVVKKYGGALCAIIFFGASLAGGHICSVWTRWVMRPLLRRLGGNPRTYIITNESNSFYSDKIKTKIHEKCMTTLGLDINDEEFQPAVPRLIRSHVLEHSSAISSRHSHIVRSRALTGNLSLPIIVLAIIFVIKSLNIISFILLCTFILLTIKQIDLDHREWKEIYLGFISAV